MNRKGVLYDVGRVMFGNWRPDYDPGVVRRELQIIAEDLHCTAVKICGRDIDRLMVAGEAAAQFGLEVWLCPELWGKRPQPTLNYIGAAAAAAERLRRQWPGKVTFSVGTELSLFMRDILPGRLFHQRVRNAMSTRRGEGAHNQPLNAFLARASDAARHSFGGPITYASLPFERVDWDLFDIIGVDHYWHQRIADRYAETLQPWLSKGKPVVVSEFGFRTRTRADETGPGGPENVAPLSVPLHLLLGTRQRVKTVHERNETLQAKSLIRQLEQLDIAGVDGAFIHTFVFPRSRYDSDPRHDIDTDSFALVKTLPRGQHGDTYPDMTWEPKESFAAVANYYAGH